MVGDGEILTEPDYEGVAAPRSFQSPKHKQGKWEGVILKVRADAVDRIEQGLEPQWAVVALYTKGGKTQTMKDRTRDRTYLSAWLCKHHRLEVWTVNVRSIPDTWYHRQLLLKFGGFMDEAQAEVYWQARREAAAVVVAAKSANAAKRKAREEAEQRDRAIRALRERPR